MMVATIVPRSRSTKRRSHTDQTRIMLNILMKNELVTRTQLAQMLGMSTIPFESIVKDLKKLGVIEEVRVDRKSHRKKRFRKPLAACNPNTRRLFRITNKGKRIVEIMNKAELALSTPKMTFSGEGDQHIAAASRIISLLEKKGARVYKDKKHDVNGDRVDAYFPDITATWPPIIIEINGKIGHSSKRSHDNELNQKAFFESKGAKFFTYSPTEIAGRGWTDSKGKRHKVHTDAELLADWGL